MSATIAGFELDVAVDEVHTFDSDVTEHPVEQGAAITDHIRPRPISVQVVGIVSDTPIGDLATRRGLFSLPSNDALAHLLAIRAARQPVTIETSLQRWERMALKSLSMPCDAENGDALRFTAIFVQIDVVTNERTTVRVASPRARGKTDRGNKPTLPADTAAPPTVKTLSGAANMGQRFPGRF